MSYGLAETLLTRSFDKEEIVRQLRKSDEAFREAMEVVLSNEHPQCWRAAWMVYHSLGQGTKKLQPWIDQLLKNIPGKTDGYQREMLKLLTKADLDEDQEGRLFDLCMTIWEKVSLIPSTRWHAFLYIVRIAKKYPELIHELEFVMQDQYAETLSPGIQKIFHRTKKQLLK